MKKVLSTALAVSIALTATLSTSSVSAMNPTTEPKMSNQSIPQPYGYKTQAKQKTYSNALYKDARKAEAYLNNIRKKSGLHPMKLNLKASKASQNHANYLAYNGYELGHYETKKGKYATGMTPDDRIEKVGIPMDVLFTSEVIAYMGDDYKKNIDALLDSAYHRGAILSPDYPEMGIGQQGEALVINPTLGENVKDKAELAKDFVYPYNGMENVPIGFYGFEDPNPLEQFKVGKSGYIISFTGYPTDDDVTFEVKDSKGNVLSYFSEVDMGTMYFFPKIELAYDEKYTSSLKYKNRETGKEKTRTWSFTTKKETIDLYMKSNEANLVINGKIVPTYIEDDYTGYNDYSKPIIKNGIAYIKSGYIFPRLNGTASYSSKTGKTTVKTKSKTIIFKTDSKKATVNGKNKTLSQAPIKVGGKVYVPISLLKTTMGINGTYNKKKNTVSLTGKLDIPYKYKTNLRPY